MRAILLLCVGFIFKIMPVAGQPDITPDDSERLSYYLNKYNLPGKELYIVTVNPDVCIKCRIGIARFNDKVTSSKEKEEVVYLLRGIRESERNYYIDNELSFLSKKDNAFIIDEDFFKLVDPKYQSSLVHIIDYKINSSYYINDFSERTVNRENIIFADDSILIDESHAPISIASRYQILDSARFILMDPRYNNLSIYSDAKLSKTCKISYDYRTLYEKFISSDPERINYAVKHRETIKNNHLKELTLGSIHVQGAKVYLTCKILFCNEKPETRDTVINNYPFLIITDTTFKDQKFAAIPIEGSYFPRYNNAFGSDGKEFIFTFMDEGQEPDKRYLAIYKYNKRKNRLTYKKVLNVKLHPYFTDHKINHMFGPNDIAYIQKVPFFYFNWAIPAVYNKDTLVYSYPDTSLNSFTYKMWLGAPLKFELIKFGEWDNSTVVFITAEEGKIYASLMNKQSRKIEIKRELDARIAQKGKYFIYNKRIYILKSGNKNTYMYKVELK